MIAVKFPVECAHTGQATLRKFRSPIREEWQQDGTWTGLFEIAEDEKEDFYQLVSKAGDGDAQTKEIEDEDEIPGFRMALYLF